MVFDLQYADDDAIPSHTTDGLQQNLLLAAESYQCAGLVVNTKKTKILPQLSKSPSVLLPAFTICGDALYTVHLFTYHVTDGNLRA